MRNFLGCCGEKFGVTAVKYIGKNFDRDYFGGKLKYVVECPVCGKKTEYCNTSEEAIKKWKSINKKVA